jgi:uncharacterized membrane protein YgaE (UPF0421/DUF939 family)
MVLRRTNANRIHRISRVLEKSMKTLDWTALKAKLVYPSRTTLAAVLALCAARLLAFPEVYWAAISALVVVQSDFGSSLTMSWHRLAGTALGAAVGALLAADLGRSVLVYGLGVFGIGVLSAVLRLERPANRFAAIAFSIVLLVVRAAPAWVVALHRFLEVSTGILAGLLLSALWPERPQNPGKS